MRLIDADKLELKHFVQWTDVVVGYNGTQPKHKHTDIIAYDISGAPTVNAIPIEWIERWLDRVTGTKDGDDISEYHDIVKGGILFINMLERDWEKENE